MDPAIHECFWLMIVVVCVCRLGEEYMRGCGGVCVWVSGGSGQEGYVCWCDSLYYGLFLTSMSVYYYHQFNCF